MGGAAVGCVAKAVPPKKLGAGSIIVPVAARSRKLFALFEGRRGLKPFNPRPPEYQSALASSPHGPELLRAPCGERPSHRAGRRALLRAAPVDRAGVARRVRLLPCLRAPTAAVRWLYRFSLPARENPR